ncbi:MAG: tRNA guanosine(15) transglycosylase TgtA [Sulfolobales archaeon]
MNSVFEIKDRDLLGRIGVIHTKSGKIETPVFFPVIHPSPESQEITVEEILKVGFNTLITNAYIVKRIYGEEAIKRGLKNILSFKGVLMTDSGAYQILRYGSIDVDNRSIVEYQEKLDQDIAVILDIPTRSDASYIEALESVKETIRRAREVLDIVSNSEKIWVLPIQGGSYADLVELSAKEALNMPQYSMYGIGSPVTFLENYEYDKILRSIIIAKKILPPDKPVHLFGAGHPMIMPFAVALGVDSFDSASYLLYARENRYLTEYGTERLEDLEEFPCSCPVCSKYTPKDLREMSEKERIRLLALHNLYVIMREIKRIKTAIRENRFWELIKERSHSHPRLRSVLRIITGEVDFISRYTPFSKGRRGIFITEYIDVVRPQIIIAKRKKKTLISYILEKNFCEEIYLLPGDPDQKPYSSSKRISESLRELTEGRDFESKCIFYYTPVMGIVPRELEETYPYSHYEYSVLSDDEEIILRDLYEELRDFIKEVIHVRREVSPRINIVLINDISWVKNFARYLKDLFEEPNLSKHIQIIYM